MMQHVSVLQTPTDCPACYPCAGAQVFNQVMTGVYLFQVVMLALLAVKRFPFAALLLPLILGTAMMHVAAMRAFSRPWELLSLRDARQLDMQDAEVTGVF
jgi:hypothetical protein